MGTKLPVLCRYGCGDGACELRGNCGDVTLSLWWTEIQDVEPSVSMGFGCLPAEEGRELAEEQRE
jgi:hypothetical protein